MNTVSFLAKLPALILPFIFFAVVAHAEWKPPEKPDPFAILREVKQDIREGRYEDALAKQVWFYQYALKSKNGGLLAGGPFTSNVRKTWQELGKLYPPALHKLKEMRNDIEKTVQAGKDVYDSFADFASINRVLGEEKLTTKLFVWLDANNALGAKQAFRFAERELVNERQYNLAAKYLHPETDFQNLAVHYRLAVQFSKRELDETVKGAAEENFSNQTTELVALLVKADRMAEAESIAAEARKEWDSLDFNARLKKALEGIFPYPVP